jgi:mevalonate kinase
MNKAETVEQLHNAKKAHVKWVQRAKALIEGLPIEKEAIPVDCTECKFGQWFYSDGQHLNAIPGMDCLHEIEKLHFNLHDMYMKIFKVYFGDMNRSFFSKLFNMKKSISDSDKDIAKDYYDKLLEISHQLLEVIDRLERRLHAMSADAFKKSVA